MFRYFAQPFPPPDIPPGTFVSPLDVRAAEIGGPAVKTALTEPGPAAIGGFLDAFFADSRGKTALAKALHVTFENRLRIAALHADPLDGHWLGRGIVPPPLGHPLDRAAWAALLPNRTPPDEIWRFGAYPRLCINLLLRVGRLMLDAVAIGIKYGKVTSAGTRYAIGVPAVVFREWTAFREVAMRSGTWQDNTLLVLADRESSSPSSSPWPPRADISTLAVDPRRWRRYVLIPALRLISRTIFLVTRRLGDPWTLQAAIEAIDIARESLPVHRVSHSFRFSWYLDVEEYAARHIVKAMVLGREGTRLVRWPHSVMDSAGATLSFLGYDLYLAPGTYVPPSFGFGASVPRREAVGMVQNDTRLAGQAGHRYRDEIARFKAGGPNRRVVVYFMPSALGYRDNWIRSILWTLARVFGTREDWLIAIKPKGTRSERQFDSILAGDPALAEALRQALVVRYPSNGVETCPAGVLIEEMAVGVGFGSIPYEALTRGKPAFVHNPVIHESPITKQMVEVGLLHHSSDQFEAALRRWVETPGSFDIPYDWFRDRFDPFNDGQALTRLVNLLCKNEKAHAA